MGDLATPPSVQKLQTALHAKAKDEPGYRFYALYDKVYRGDVLRHAYQCCRANHGAAGVDGVRFEDIEACGVEGWLGELAKQLKEKTYQADAIRRVHIPKPNGKLRPLGIPTVRDRVAQMAMVLLLGPIFEADLPPEQYAYRPERNAHDAIQQVHSLLQRGHTQVVDADLAAYFDSIPHAELMKSVARRVVDRQVLHLIKMWLEVPVEETDERGGKKRTTRCRDEKRGIPQGSPLSPLLSNLYMRRFVLGWRRKGFEARLRARVVTYADDLVICCKGSAAQALEAMRAVMGQIKLTVNEEKTRVCRVPNETFDFLGYTFGRWYSPRTGRAYLGSRPSKSSLRRVVQKVRAETDRRGSLLDTDEVVQRLNWLLRGWAQYFCLGPVSKSYRALDRYTLRRLRRWLCHKHKVHSCGYTRFPATYFYGRLGLVQLQPLTKTRPWANA
ncbi:MAG TPA: group II intron reverse transcriptase/maturase [Chloroflexota bacterium]